MLRKSTLVITVAFMVTSGVEAEPLPDWFYKPMGKVGELGKVGKLEKLRDDRSPDDRKLQPIGAVVCWTWSASKEPGWRCTAKYEENLGTASEFAYYMTEKYSYKYGGAVVIAVYKKDWDDPDTRKAIMERIQKEAIPAYLKELARRQESNANSANKELAAAMRKQIKFVQPNWVDAAPVLKKDSKEWKAAKNSKVEVPKNDGFRDEFLFPNEGPNCLVGTKWEQPAEFATGGMILKFVSPTTIKWTTTSAKGAKLPQRSGEWAWSQKPDGSYDIEMGWRRGTYKGGETKLTMTIRFRDGNERTEEYKLSK